MFNYKRVFLSNQFELLHELPSSAFIISLDTIFIKGFAQYNLHHKYYSIIDVIDPSIDPFFILRYSNHIDGNSFDLMHWIVTDGDRYTEIKCFGDSRCQMLTIYDRDVPPSKKQVHKIINKFTLGRSE